MTRPALALAFLLATSCRGLAEEQPSSTPIENRPYRIALHLAFAPEARFDAGRRHDLVERWQGMVRRFVGPAWSVHVAESPSPLAGQGLERIRADELQDLGPTFDKVWLIWISVGTVDADLVFLGREYDAATRWLGPLQTRTALSSLDAPREFFRFTIDLFSPSALIVGQEGGRALLKVQGAAIPAASPLGAVVAKGTTFIPLRLVTMRDDSVRITRIAFTYLATESVEGSLARCAIVSAFRDPLSQRIARPNTLAALGIKPGDSTLHFRFIDRGTKGPAAGYTLTERPAPDGPIRNVGMTDRGGRIAVEPGPTRGVVKLRLLAGDSEPLAEFPIMPGESSEEREIPVDPLPLASAYQVRLDALRDQIVDQVALRGRLERLMQSRVEGEDWTGLQELLKQYDLLRSPSTFSESVKKLKDEATKQSYEASKTTVLTRHLQAEFDELQGLIDGYLTNDASQAFAEVLESQKKRQAEASQAAQKKAVAATAPKEVEVKAAPPPTAQPPAEKPGAPRADVP